MIDIFISSLTNSDDKTSNPSVRSGFLEISYGQKYEAMNWAVFPDQLSNKLIECVTVFEGFLEIDATLCCDMVTA